MSKRISRLTTTVPEQMVWAHCGSPSMPIFSGIQRAEATPLFIVNAIVSSTVSAPWYGCYTSPIHLAAAQRFLIKR